MHDDVLAVDAVPARIVLVAKGVRYPRSLRSRRTHASIPSTAFVDAEIRSPVAARLLPHQYND